MSEPARWGPPANAAPRPTAPYQLPPADDPTVRLPVAPPPQARRPVAPHARPPVDYGDHDPYRDDDRDAYRERRPRRRGQLFAGLVLVLTLIVAGLLGVLTYRTLASVDITSADRLGALAGWVTALGAAALGALVVFVLAVIALVIARPKALAGLGLLASVLLPIGAVVVGLIYGGDVLRQNVEQGAARAGPAAVELVVKELERHGLNLGPLRDLIVRLDG